MFVPVTRAAEERVRVSRIQFPQKTTDEDVETLLSGCGCDYYKLLEILHMVPTLHNIVTAHIFNRGKPKPIVIYIVPAGHSRPDNTKELNEIANRWNCRIKFTLHDTETGIMRVEPMK